MWTIIWFIVSFSGDVIYSEITTFMEKHNFAINRFIKIATSNNMTISLSGNHLIYARKVNIDKFLPMYV